MLIIQNLRQENGILSMIIQAAANEITYNTEILKSNLCDHNDAYILVTGNITVVTAYATQVAFKNCAAFATCITKIDGANNR